MRGMRSPPHSPKKRRMWATIGKPPSAWGTALLDKIEKGVDNFSPAVVGNPGRGRFDFFH
jgi:hypothetical protein